MFVFKKEPENGLELNQFYNHNKLYNRYNVLVVIWIYIHFMLEV